MVMEIALKIIEYLQRHKILLLNLLDIHYLRDIFYLSVRGCEVPNFISIYFLSKVNNPETWILLKKQESEFLSVFVEDISC